MYLRNTSNSLKLGFEGKGILHALFAEQVQWLTIQKGGSFEIIK